MKSHFLARYYTARRRPLVDHIAIGLETFVRLLAAVRPALHLVSRVPSYDFTARMLGLIDPPRPSTRSLRQQGLETMSAEAAAALAPDDNLVLLVQDPFTAVFDTPAVVGVADGLRALGYRPMALAVQAGGKAAHVKGDRLRFSRQAQAFAEALSQAARSGAQLIGIDPSLIYMLRSEYPKAGITEVPKVFSAEEFLVEQLKAGRAFPKRIDDSAPMSVFTHCTERSMRPAVAADWRKIFEAVGAPAKVIDAGCCGMSGLFGHEERHLDWSKQLYAKSWAREVDGAEGVFATGFSCRCQVKRMSKSEAAHPMALIARHLSG